MHRPSRVDVALALASAVVELTVVSWLAYRKWFRARVALTCSSTWWLAVGWWAVVRAPSA
jgi:hypothetical protein